MAAYEPIEKHAGDTILSSEINAMSERLSHTMSLFSGDSEVLEDGTDLNTVTTAGNYLVATSTAAATMLNIPEAKAGRLIVMAGIGAGWFYQIYFANRSTMPIYIRYCGNTYPTIQPWKLLSMTEVGS